MFKMLNRIMQSLFDKNVSLIKIISVATAVITIPCMLATVFLLLLVHYRIARLMLMGSGFVFMFAFFVYGIIIIMKEYKDIKKDDETNRK